MSRMKQELRKQELLDIAFRQFLRQGYEKTSIRSIVGEANGEIGMFYHYFSSKEEIFAAVLEQYNIAYVEKIKETIRKGREGSFWLLVENILSDLEDSLAEYAGMNSGASDQEVLAKLHHKTLVSLKPVFSELIREYKNRGEISPPNIDLGSLTDFLLYGISALIHNSNEDIKSEESKTARREAIKELILRLLGTVPEH